VLAEALIAADDENPAAIAQAAISDEAAYEASTAILAALHASGYVIAPVAPAQPKPDGWHTYHICDGQLREVRFVSKGSQREAMCVHCGQWFRAALAAESEAKPLTDAERAALPINHVERWEQLREAERAAESEDDLTPEEREQTRLQEVAERQAVQHRDAEPLRFITTANRTIKELNAEIAALREFVLHVENITKPLDLDMSGRANHTSLTPLRVSLLHAAARALLDKP
jgi:hypothetical protein